MITLAEWHLHASPQEARRVREALTDLLAEHQVADSNHFLLACAELIVNLYNYPDPKPESVIVRFGHDNSHWVLEVLDNGPTFTQFNQLLTDTSPAIAAEQGMGLKLLASYFSDFNYVPACYREDACNMMVLCKPKVESTDSLQRILLVDDDPTYRAVLAAYLANNYIVLHADSVSVAKEQILKYKPSLVICDLLMPEQDGTVLFDQISYIPELASTAIVYLSGCHDQDLITRVANRPIDDFLAKPVDKETLLSVVKRVLLRRAYIFKQIQRAQNEKITLGLQPRAPESLDDYQCSVRCVCPEPGGGDLLQFYKAEDSTLMVFADLMGHGISPKGYAYALAGYLKGICSARKDLHENPSGLLEQLSLSFDSDPLLQETLATLMAISLRDKGEVCIANGGHPLPILVSTQRIGPIEIDGPLPGLGLNHYREQTLMLNKGERLIFFSDGFLDAGGPMPTALSAVLKESAALPLSAASDLLLQWRLNSSEINDDITLVLLEPNPASL